MGPRRRSARPARAGAWDRMGQRRGAGELGRGRWARRRRRSTPPRGRPASAPGSRPRACRARGAWSSASTCARARSPSPCSTPRRASRCSPRWRSPGSRSTPRPIATRSACSRASRAATRGTPRSTCAGRTWPSSCPLLEGQRVLLEPALMQLRFGEEPRQAALRSRARRRRHHHRQDELRARQRQAPLLAAPGRLVRGLAELADRHPGGHRPPRRQARLAGGDAAPAALAHHRRADARAGAAHHAGAAQGRAGDRRRAARPRPDRRGRRPRRPPSACAPAARSSRPASSCTRPTATTEIQVRADGITPPVHHPAARGGDEARALRPRRHRRPAGRGEQARSGSACAPTSRASSSSPTATPRSASGARASPSSRTPGTSSSPRIWSTRRCATSPSASSPR